MRVGVDVGGTFTDLVAVGGGRIITAKVPSTPRDQAQGVVHAVRAAAVDPAEVLAFAHGSTVATNALLERRGAKVALITTEGFLDVIEIARQNRFSLYDLTRDRPPALVPRELRFGVRERMGPEGVLVDLDEGSVAAAVERCRRAEVEAVAVCLLFGFLHPAHERRVGAALRTALPGVQISLSCDVLPEFREYERTSTTVVDAYLTPRLSAYLRNLTGEVERLGLPAPLVMQSSGGVLDAQAAAASGAACVLSGPAGGVVGAAYVAALSGYPDVLTFDMGGTSTDVATVVDGQVRTTTETVIAGVPVRLPMVDVHTVSAGGGSIARLDEGGALRVGPRSAGADPGPAAYGLGGTEPTVTDANLVLGYLAEGPLGGGVALDRGRAEAALTGLGLGERLGGPPEVARGVVEVANAEMVRALRRISVERGLDPREFALVAFGGAGGLHACALATELGVGTVLVPRVAGVLSALGLALTDLRRDYALPLPGRLDEVAAEVVEEGFAGLERQARADLADPVLERRADLRYTGQSFELTVEASHLPRLSARFAAEHERRYGYAIPDEPVELVTLRLVATAAVERPDLSEPPAPERVEPGRRTAHFDGETREVDVVRRVDLGAGSGIEGPAIVDFAEATCVVPPGWRGTVDEVGTLVLTWTR